MMDPKELAKAPPGLPRWRWMARNHPIELGVWMLALAAAIYTVCALWPF